VVPTPRGHLNTERNLREVDRGRRRRAGAVGSEPVEVGLAGADGAEERDLGGAILGSVGKGDGILVDVETDEERVGFVRLSAFPRCLPTLKSGVQWSMQRSNSMSREFSVIIERDTQGYYIGSVPALKGCHTQAKSLDELMSRIREAIELCLEAQGNRLEPLDFIGVQRVTVG